MQYLFHLSMRSLLLCLFLIAAVVSLQAQSNLVYVDQNATGANNGTSWTDAYTHLSDALTEPTAEIWVAAGTYCPDSVSIHVSFNVHGTQQLYGGFAGYETMRSQRDHTLNPSIISGDIGQDDLMSPALSDTQVVGNNSRRLINYLATTTSDVVIDGFTLTAGQNPDEAGGAISVLQANIQQSQINLSVRNCKFSANVAANGGAIYVNGSTCVQNILIEDCEFVGNASKSAFMGTKGGAIYFWGESEAVLNNEIRRSIFESNYSDWKGGAIYYNGHSYFNFMTIDSCSFSNNLAASTLGGYGGAIFGSAVASTIDIKILNSSFTNNEAKSVYPGDPYNEGAGALHLYTDLTDESFFTVENCQFISNRVSKNGQGDCINIVADKRNPNTFPLANLDLKFKYCIFNDNGVLDNKPNNGGAISVYSNALDVDIDIFGSKFNNNHGQKGGAFFLSMKGNPDISLNLIRSQFENNTAHYAGGGISIYDDNSLGSVERDFVANIEQCQFSGNSALIGGGFSNHRNEAGEGNYSLSFKQNRFASNSSQTHGGAIYSDVKNIGHQISFQADSFSTNQAINNGGAISLISAYGPSDYEFDQIYFADNSATKGGAIYIKGGTNNIQKIELTNAKFFRNTAADGGAILGENLGGSFDLKNTLMIGNQASNQAAALYISNRSLLTCNLLASTFSQNTAQGGIDLFFVEGPNTAPSLFNISNSIMWANGSGVYLATLGNVSPSINHSLLNVPAPGNGNINADPEFMDPANDDFQLSWNSPAIDAGQSTENNGPLDLNGNPRIQGSAIDLGAYESPFTTSIESPKEKQLSFFPNPSHGQVFISLSQFSIYDEVTIKLYDPLGKLVFEDRFAERLNQELALDFGSLNAGLFLLTVQIGGQTYSQNLIIQ